MVNDHGNVARMRTMAISRFKATCLAVLEQVRKTKQPVRVTRFGEPIADVVPHSADPRPKAWLGSLSGTARITGDIVSPATPLKEWDDSAK